MAASIDDILALYDLAVIGKTDRRLGPDVEAALIAALGKGVANGFAGLNSSGVPVTATGVPMATIGTVAGTAADAGTVAAALTTLTSQKLSVAGGTMTGALVVQAPTAAGNPATKAYVDAASGSSFAVVRYVSGAWPVRPTSSTSVTVEWVGPTQPPIGGAYAVANVDLFVATP